MEIKDIIKERRKELGLTLQDIADKVGVSTTTVYKWESGYFKNVKSSRVIALARVLNVPPNILLNEKVEENEKELYYKYKQLCQDKKLTVVLNKLATLNEKELNFIVSYFDTLNK